MSNTTPAKKLARVANLACKGARANDADFLAALESFERGEAKEVWGAKLCKAYGLAHGLPSNLSVLAALCGQK